MLNPRTFMKYRFIVPRFQSQINHANEILKKLQPGDEDQSVKNIPAAVKGALDDIDEKFMQHNGISKIVDITSCYIEDFVCDCRSF